MAHLVDRAIAGANADGRIIRIPDILRGVVVGVVHVNDRALGEKDGLAETIDRLAIDVPVADPDEPFLLPIGKSSVALDILTEIMRVRIDAEDVDIDGQLQLVFNNETVISGGNVECAVVLELEEHGLARRGLVGEVKAYLGINGLELS